MSKCFKCSNCCNCKHSSFSTDNYCWRTDNFLCRRVSNIDFQCRKFLFMVDRSNYFFYQRYNSRFLYRSSDQCSGMPEYIKCSNCCDCKYSTNSTNNYSWWSYNFLRRRVGDTDFQRRKLLFVVHRRYNCFYQRNNRRFLYRSGYESFRMSKYSKRSNCGNSKCFTGNTDDYCRRSYNFLCRRVGYIDFQCR